MKENQQKFIENNFSDNDPVVKTEEKSLILIEFKAKRNIDQTINTPLRYVSRYQYNVRNIDKYLQLCPHCKKPTLSAFEKSVIDSATDYLNGKRIFEAFPMRRSKVFPGAFFMFALAIIFYFIFNYI